MEQEFEQLAHALSELDPPVTEYETAADRYSHVEGRLRHHDVYALDAQVGTVLTGLGFAKEDWTRRTEEFSGGWQMRIALAKLLLEKPDLLLLDEPTNHLDLETRNWLENYLSTWENGYILISHDRYFLDVTVNKIIEIWNKGLHVYHGNYEKYLTQKAERRAQLESAYKNQRERIEHLEVFISRFRYQATKAKQVQSRIKELDKIERIEIPLEEPVPHFSFPQPPPSGGTWSTQWVSRCSTARSSVLENVQLHHRSRGPDRAGGCEWRGQIDADPAAVQAGVADEGHAEAGAQRAGGVLRAGSVQGAGSGGADAGRHWASGAEGGGEGSAEFAGMLSVLRR